jgi:hypothetical protein
MISLDILGLFLFRKNLMLLMQLKIYSRRFRLSKIARLWEFADHGREFKNSKFEEFCLSCGIKHEFSSPITPQQNGVVERKNRVIQEMACVMIHSKNLAQHFWGKAVNIACHIINRFYLRPETNNTPYEIWRGKKPTVTYFRTFGSKWYILRDRENLGKFDPKTDEGIFLGYSLNTRAYRVFNKRIKTVMESINVVIDDEEVERPSSGEENQLISVEVTDRSTDNIKASPSVSPDEPPSPPTASDTISSASEDEDSPNYFVNTMCTHTLALY